jgi:HTH-type transcriptional regulator/antitoxin HigA
VGAVKEAAIYDFEAAATPADALRAGMALRSWSQSDLAYVLGVNTAAINQILSGKRGVSSEMAKALAVAFDVEPEFFARLQADFELKQARDPEPELKARARIQTEYPLREMIKRGWFTENAVELEPQLCRFFDVQALGEVPHLAHAAKRTEVAELPPSQLAWLFRVRQIAREMIVSSYSRGKLAAAIDQMRGLLGAPEDTRHVPRLLAEAGVRFVIVEALPGSKIDGVCFWLDDNSPVIGMSIRFDRIDNFWFVLRHECAHVMHGHGRRAPIVDSDLGNRGIDVSEEELLADSEAAEFCLPQDKIKSFYLRKNPIFPERDVLAFAKIAHVHPGMVVGQLQHLIGRYDFLRRHLVSIRNHVSRAATVDGWGDVFPVGP